MYISNIKIPIAEPINQSLIVDNSVSYYMFDVRSNNISLSVCSSNDLK